MHRHKKRKARRGFTLVELLVAVLILSILMNVGIPYYLKTVDDAEKKTCRANMQTIANSVQAARVKTIAANYAALYSANVSTNLAKYPDLTTAPMCPDGGIYSVSAGVSAGNFKVTCTTSPDTGHGSFEPGLDSQ